MTGVQTAGLWLLALDLAFIAVALSWIAVQDVLDRRADVRFARLERALGRPQERVAYLERKRWEKARERHPASRGGDSA